MPGKSYKADEATTGACLDEVLLYRYLEKLATKDERQRVEQHLNACQNCFNDFTALAWNIHAPATEAEKAEVAQLRKLTPHEQVEKILDYIETENPLPDPKANPFGVLNTFFEKLIQWLLSPRTALITAILAVFIVGVLIVGRYRTREASSLADVERELHQGYQVYINLMDFKASAPRLSGNYLHEPIYRMSARDSTPPYLLESRRKLTTALAGNPQSVRAMHLLAQTFMMQDRYAQADSVLRQIPAAALQEAGLLNDQGVLHLALHDTAAAVQNFETAIRSNPKFVEARYNLALIKAKRGAIAEAIANLEEAIKSETDEGWRSVIAPVLEEMKNNDR